MRDKPFYRVSRFDMHGYLKAEVEVNPDDRNGISDPPLRFAWQSHREDDEWSEWYAFRLIIEAQDRERFKEATRLANRIMNAANGRDTDYWREVSPDAILTALERIGREAVYDSRISRLVPIDEVAPAGYRCWWTEGSAWASVLAPTEAEARAQLAVALAERDQSWELSRWVENGMPVVPGREDARPDTTPGRIRLSLAGERRLT